jgi:hypothetical protein
MLVSNSFNCEASGAANQVEVLEDAGHVVHVKSGEVKQLCDIHLPLNEGGHRQREVLLPFHYVRL